MKVLFINDGSLLNPIVSSQGIPHLRSLAAEGHTVFMLSVEPREERSRSVERDRIMRDCQGQIRFVFFRPLPAKVLKVSVQFLVAGPLFVLFLVLRHRIHLIHARSYLPAFIGSVVRSLLGTRILFDMRGLMIDEYISKGIWNRDSLTVRGMRRLERRCILTADEVVVVSDEFRRYLEDVPYVKNSARPVPITVIPNCVVPDRFALADNERLDLLKRLHLDDRIVVVYSGSLTAWQCVAEVQDFFAIFLRRIPNAYLLVATYDESSAFERGMAERSLTRHDYGIINAAFDDLPKYVSLGHFGLLFRRAELLNRVSCPIKFAEYLAAGLPVLLTAGIGDTAAIVGRYKVGAVIDSFSHSSFEDACLNMMRMVESGNEGLRQRCRRVAFEQFDLSVSVKQYADIYHRQDALS